MKLGILFLMLGIVLYFTGWWLNGCNIVYGMGYAAGCMMVAGLFMVGKIR